MCLTKNELEENNYMVIKSESRAVKSHCDAQNTQRRCENKAI